MKKYVLSALLLCIGVRLYAQQERQTQVPFTKNQIATTKVATSIDDHLTESPTSTTQINKTNSFLSPSSTSIKVGETTYDLQSNASVQRRIVQDSIGTNHIVWTMSHQNDWTDRGTGYNTVTNQGVVGDMPSSRIDMDRTGWPEIARLKSGRLVTISHFMNTNNPNNEGLQVLYKDPKDTEWTSKVLETDEDVTWVKMASVDNTIHLIYSRLTFDSTCGIRYGIIYSRSSDGGETWDIHEECIDILNSNNVGLLEGEAYALDAQGDLVAFVIGAYQATLFYSEDKGKTWQWKRINKLSSPFYTGSTTGLPLEHSLVPDENFSLIIDENKTIHVWYGSRLIYNDGFNHFHYPDHNAIVYWNNSWDENKPPQVIGKTVRQDGDGDKVFHFDFRQYGFNRYRRAGLVTMPSAGVDKNGHLYVAYRSIVENNFDPYNQYLSDIFLIKSTDGGATWQGPLNITNTTDKEEAYPSIPARIHTDKIPIVYQSDKYAGNTYFGDLFGYTHPVTDNTIYLSQIDPTTITNPSSPTDTRPQMVVNIPEKIIKGCHDNRINVLTLDYPDGEVDYNIETDLFDHLDQVDTCFDVTISVEDSNGNVVEEIFGSQTGPNNEDECVTIIEDQSPPFISLIPNWVLLRDSGFTIMDEKSDYHNIDVIKGTDWQPLGADIFDDSQIWGCEPTLTINNPVNTNIVGTYQVCYNGYDIANHPAEQVCRIINVIEADTEPPIITIRGLNNDTIASGDTIFYDLNATSYSDLGFRAFDRVDHNNIYKTTKRAPFDIKIEGAYIDTFWTSDQSGNAAIATKVRYVRDPTPPTINIPGDSLETWICSKNLTLPDVTALDVSNENLTDQLTLVMELACTLDDGSTCRIEIDEIPSNVQGELLLTYTVIDKRGNKASKTKTYQLYDDTSNCPQWCETAEGIAALTSQACWYVGNQEDLLHQQIMLYPNPTTGYISLDLKHTNLPFTIDIFDAKGRHIYQQKTDSTDTILLDITDQTPGIYLVKITTDKGSTTKKVILNH